MVTGSFMRVPVTLSGGKDCLFHCGAGKTGYAHAKDEDGLLPYTIYKAVLNGSKT